MALLQALLTFLGRSVSRILDAILGWAVVALFGRTAPKQKTLLTVLVAVAALWPLLLLGVAFPKVAALVIAFVPLHDQVPSFIVRIVWVVLALVVPLVVGTVVAKRAPPGTILESKGKRLLRGFPITVGIAGAFLLLFVTIPLLRLASIRRRQKDEHLPLITDRKEYERAVAKIDDVNRRFSLELVRHPPPWWLAWPSAILLKLGGKALHNFVPPHLSYWKAPKLELALYSSDLLIRGPADQAAFAHAILTECFAAGPGLSTYGAVAQEVEREIHQVWSVLEENRAHVHSKVLAKRLDDIGEEISHLAVDWEDWQVLYRKSLQLGRALCGDGQILQSLAAQEQPMQSIVPSVHNASTGELVTQLMKQTGDLVKAEMTLARAEIKNDVRAEMKMFTRAAVAGMCFLWAVDVLLAAAVLGIAVALPAWASALIVGGVMLGLALIAALLAYTKRVHAPLQKTTKTLQENVRWAKERLA